MPSSAASTRSPICARRNFAISRAMNFRARSPARGSRSRASLPPRGGRERSNARAGGVRRIRRIARAPRGPPLRGGSRRHSASLGQRPYPCQATQERPMTPQERELIADLFDRLAELEDQPRDPEAERAIAECLARAPHAIYPLVQTVLVQDEALKAANAHIEALEGREGDSPPARPAGFLDSMRDALFGRSEARPGSVPSVRPGMAAAPPQAPFG